MWELKIGDVLGDKYTILERIGQGGFGVVYKVFANDVNEVKALKALRPDLALSDANKYRYIKEAEIWTELGRHPFVVMAHVIERFDNKIYIVTDYVEPGVNGLNSLESYLANSSPDLKQILIWSIQFCYGIEYAYSKKVRAHRDIKPSNIMIDKSGNVKINDFGLAGTIHTNDVINMHCFGSDTDARTCVGIGVGTPAYMSPEQFLDVAGCDERSDIYSFGIVLYQMASGGLLPFNASNNSQYWQIMKHQHETAMIPTLNSPLFNIIKQCLGKKPSERIQSFLKLRVELESFLWQFFSVKVNCNFEDLSQISSLVNKGLSLTSTRKYIEAINCFDEALALKPIENEVRSLIINNKAASLTWLKRYDEALTLYDESISINNFYLTWYNKGNLLLQLCNYKEAIYCYNKAIELNNKLSIAYYDKGCALNKLELYNDALFSLDRALQLNPKHIKSISLKGRILYSQKNYIEAIKCFKDIIEIDSSYFDAWNYMGSIYLMNKSYDKSLKCFEKAASILPDHEGVHQSKANIFIELGRFNEGINELSVVLQKNPNNLDACNNMAFALFSIGNFKKALIIIDHALSINITDKWAIDFKKSILAKLNPAKAAIPANIANNDSSIPGKLPKFLGGFLK